MERLVVSRIAQANRCGQTIRNVVIGLSEDGVAVGCLCEGPTEDADPGGQLIVGIASVGDAENVEVRVGVEIVSGEVEADDPIQSVVAIRLQAQLLAGGPLFRTIAGGDDVGGAGVCVFYVIAVGMVVT